MAKLRVLNVGSGPVEPCALDGWEMVTLDINPDVHPDICGDVRGLSGIASESYEAVYCSHMLEHLYRHEVPDVLAGFLRVLKPGGCADLAVPNMQALAAAWLNHDIDDVWHQAPAGPITFHDVIYGFSGAMKQGNLHYAHKCGFSAASLGKLLTAAGFAAIQIMEGDIHLRVIAQKAIGADNGGR